jgi:hypothetical protein
MAAWEAPSPAEAGLLTEAAPFALRDIEQALEQFLDQLGELHAEVHTLLASLGVWPWVVLGLVTLAASAELLRRRPAQSPQLIAASVGSLSLSWLLESDDSAGNP